MIAGAASGRLGINMSQGAGGATVEVITTAEFALG